MPPTVKLAGDAFGEEHAALMFGWIAASNQIGALAVAWLAGILRTQTGDYSIAFFLSGLFSILAAFLAAFVGSGSKRNLLAEPKESAWGEKDLNEKGYGWRTRLTIFAVMRLAVLLWALFVTASARGAAFVHSSITERCFHSWFPISDTITATVNDSTAANLAVKWAVGF